MTIFDIETDGLMEEATKIHVVSYQQPDMSEPVSIFKRDEMVDFFLKATELVGHNIIRFDIPVVEKLLGISIKARLVDTLALSWYLHHSRPRHGLEGYGEDFGVPKPVIEDWSSLTPEEYAHRCSEDVKINYRLYQELTLKLNRLYSDEVERNRFVDYLMFKMDCAREQEALGWRLDVEKAKMHLEELERQMEEKELLLADAMPTRKIYKERNVPKQMHKADGSMTLRGEAWVALLKEMKLPPTTQKVNVLDREEKANPNSSVQVKDWLYSLGWEPRTFEFKRNKDTGEERSIPQVRSEGELCDSIKELSDRDPAVHVLDGLSVIQHRLGIFKSFIANERDGYVKAEIAGFTNTLRFRHSKPLVNLPSVDKPWGAEIRGCLIAPEGYTLCGSDMTSLEDTTKRHYMKPLDPNYVEEMSREGFDPHLDLAKHAGVISQEDIDRHNSGERSLKALRKNYKVVNYSATYGVGATKLSRTTGMTVGESQKLLDAFWSRNWSVQKVAEDLYVRELFGSSWVQNPVSGFWYSLRSDKDRFSTLNQGTGVFCFDTWVAFCRAKGLKTIGQFHDEVIVLVKQGEENWTKAQMEAAINKANDRVKLNVPLGIDVQFGKTYADIH